MLTAREPSRILEGGLCALVAGMVGQYAGYVVFRLFQLFRDWVASELFNQPRALVGMPVSFVFVPPPHIWNTAAVVGAVIGLVAYWIHTSTSDARVRTKRRRIFNFVVTGIAVVVGRGMNFIADWGVLVMALDDIVSLLSALWVTWQLVALSDMLAQRLRQ
jgi:uncharacterized membrane protein YeaQ/YmgE (transglycosylase-associated protein family)